ncbi:baseplate J/gp47 family protein [Chromobacterium amazonense]|uniref:baseplate J/gp47 family protein n=1 Tax=Chromobacterium amazonense TaxID=1382803 RepID=UPI00237D354C|nr:baseplate J/gp47 family protein [Chromobacterium amazonense]MDE1715755.1 baseplate J/gp47 family protein [Chromobacterium amazonense]
MPYAKPTLTALRQQVAQDIAASIPGGDGLLRFSNLGVMASAQAAMAYGHYDYIDFVAKQSTPWTATGEFLQGWGAMKGVYIKPATPAAGSATFPGQINSPLPAGTLVTRGDGQQYTVATSGVVGASGTVTVPITAVPDPAGLAGAVGNGPAGTLLSLAQSVPGIQAAGAAATPLTGGADLEDDESYRARVLAAWQSTPQGGARSDYEMWALAVPGVTRAWCAPNGFGAGTVVVYVMLDGAESASGGFPVGSNGISQFDQGPGGAPRGVVATGDQLAVANALAPLQPVTALVYVVAPIANPVPFTIKGVPLASQAAVALAIAGVFYQYGKPGGSIPLQLIWSAIATVSGVSDFIVVSPSGSDITSPVGNLPVLGPITWQ